MVDVTIKSTVKLDLSDPDEGSGISAQMKVHCRTDEDIDMYILAAVALFEGESGRSIKQRSLLLTTSWVGSKAVQLCRGPVTKINSVKYYSSGTMVSLGSKDYRLVSNYGGQLIPSIGNVWPCPGTTIEVSYEVGLGYLDEKAFQAVAMLTGHYYKNREAVELGGKAPAEVPMAVRSLINSAMDD